MSARARRVTARARGSGDGWIVPLLLLALAVWFVETGGALWRTSHWDHYVYLADAFLHGRLHLIHIPPDALDIAYVDRRLFVVYGPFPALLLLPLVALFGPATPDVAALVLTGLFGIFAFARFLSALPDRPDAFRRAMATLTFALGTAMHYGTPMGSIWLHAQITATALQCWGLWMAARGRATWSGVAFGATVLTRPSAALALPAALWLLTRRPGSDPAPAGPRSRFRPALALFVPILVATLLYALYNLARFGNPAETGYGSILLDPRLKPILERHGSFSLHFLPHNLGGWLLALPRFERGGLVPDGHGMSLLLTTPFLFLLFVPRRPRTLEWVLLADCVAIAVPALLYYNDGWAQFGQRFALDWIALALATAAIASERAPAWLIGALAAIGVVVNAWGTLWFQSNVLH